MGNVPPKKVLNADPGTADLVGGNDWDDLVDFLNDSDKTGPVKINTELWFRTGKLKFRDSGNDHLYIHNFANLAANRNVAWPLLTADDEVTFNAFAQTLTNKTINPKDNTLQLQHPTVLMMKSGSTYYAIKYDGTIISSSTTAETVIAAAIAVKGVIHFVNNQATSVSKVDWTLSAGFTGFTIPDGYVHIVADPNIFLIVPQGYTGIVFKIGGSGNDPDDASINGFYIKEGGSPAKLWTAVKLEIVTGGSAFCTVLQNMQIGDCNVAYELETTGTGFITNCIFRDITIYDSNIGFLFDITGGECSENLFQNIQFETNGAATWGWKNITGTGNTFINCKAWDMAAGGTEMNIVAGSSGTTIIGGRVTGGGAHFIDDGVKTLILDSGNTTNFRLQPTPDLVKIGTWSGIATTAGDGLLNGRLSQIVVGTGTDTNAADSTGVYRSFNTGAVSGGMSGSRLNDISLLRINNAYFKAKLRLDNNTATRVFVGLVASSSAPTATSDPLNAREGVALWFDSAVSANWKRLHNDTVGSGTVDDTSMAALTGTEYIIEIYAVADTKFRFVFNGVSTDISSNIPGSTTALAYWFYIENTASAAKSMRAYYTIVRSDK